jgi:hypothetical protein
MESILYKNKFVNSVTDSLTCAETLYIIKCDRNNSSKGIFTKNFFSKEGFINSEGYQKWEQLQLS